MSDSHQDCIRRGLGHDEQNSKQFQFHTSVEGPSTSPVGYSSKLLLRPVKFPGEL